MPVHIDRSLRLAASEYSPGTQRTTGIAIHLTVGGSAQSTFDWWMRARRSGGRAQLVGTAELRQPRITVGRSIELIAAAEAGCLLGEAIHE